MKKMNLVMLAFIAAAPLLLPAYLTFQITQMICLGIALVGLNVLTGWAGQPSLGHGAFFAVGAYATAILVSAGVPWWVALPIAAVLGATLAFLIGRPILRLEHTYLALATFSIALAVPQLVRNNAVEKWTGGSQGVQLERPTPPSSLAQWINSDTWMYWICLLIAVVVVLSVNYILSRRLGHELRALRDHTIAASSCGIDVASCKTNAFAISVVCACLGGGLYGLNVQLVTPDSFLLFLSLTMLIGLVVGGPGTAAGPWVGAAFVQFVPNLADSISSAAPWAVFGVAVLLVVFFWPAGVVGAARRPLAALVQKTHQWLSNKPTTSPPSTPRSSVRDA